MSRTRRLVLHALLVAGLGILAFVFAQTSVGSPSQALLKTAAVACVLVGAGFAVRLAAILREGSAGSTVAAAPRASATLTHDWRVWGLVAWLIVCLAAAASEWLGGGSADAPRSVSPLSTTLLVALFAWQAFRVVSAERRLQGS